MKQRFSSLDLQIISHELSKAITGHRLSNIYDLSSRIFLLKFAKPESKHLLLVDSGFRCHLTSYSRATATAPSSFVTKLRKHLRTRRVTGVRQLGTDRVLELSFSDGEYRLFVEFYAGGNVVLVGKEGVVLAVLRVVRGGEDGANECRVGVEYQLEGRGVVEGEWRERIETILKSGVEEEGAEAQVGKWKKKQKKQKKGGEGIKKLLAAKISEFSPTLIEHCFGVMGADMNSKAEEVLRDEEKITGIVRVFEEAERVVGKIMENADTAEIKGYIVAIQPSAGRLAPQSEGKGQKKGVAFGSSEAIENQKEGKVQEEGEGKGLVFDDFHPFLPKQFENDPAVKILEYQGFNRTVDIFFSSIESQKLESRLKDREGAAVKRLESARTDHQRRVDGLRSLQEMNVRKAQAIEANLDRVEEAIAAMNALIAQGMDWVAMGRLIEQEQKRGNAVAELIKLPLKLYENIVTLRLLEEESGDEENDDKSINGTDTEEGEEGEEGREEEGSRSQNPRQTRPLEIDINLSLSAWANSSTYHNEKKTAAIKESKTIQSSSRALKSTEKKVAADLKKGLKTEKQLLTPVRRQQWFEKFFYFISSDGYLVLAGRDLQQNEILYQRHFKRGDVYVSADEEGAAMVIVKNKSGLAAMEIPPGTLAQAGVLSVSASKAWERKSGSAAWWVRFEQVGKIVKETGVFLGVGYFEITGEKSFLPPAVLILGYGVLWRIDEESARRRGRLRVDAGEEAVTQEGIVVEGGGANDHVDQAGDEEGEGGEGEGGEEKGEEAEQGEVDEEDESDSQDEEFPDAKVDLAVEEDHAQGDGDEDDEDSGVEGFPNTKVEREGDEHEPDTGGDHDEAEKDGDTDVDSISQVAAPTGKKHLSSKERRELRRARATDPVATPTPSPARASQNIHDSRREMKESLVQKKPPVRGKKGKQKKNITKYAHQDSEDRALALQLLGSVPAKTKAIELAEVKKLKTEEEYARKARRREQHEKATREGVKAEEARRHQLPEGEDEDEDEGAERVGLECFVGTSQPGDNVLEAIPICAPWGAMGTVKLKAKLQPGALRKGKAINQVVQTWLKIKEVQGKERELLQGWKASEIINCAPVSKVEVSGPGGGGEGKGSGRGSTSKRGGRGSKRK